MEKHIKVNCIHTQEIKILTENKQSKQATNHVEKESKKKGIMHGLNVFETEERSPQIC